MLYTVGGKRTSGRIDELRAEKWEIEKRHHAGQWQYRLVNPPPLPYEHFSCVCGWEGDEPQAMRGMGGYLCPSCGRAVGQAAKFIQVAFL